MLSTAGIDVFSDEENSGVKKWKNQRAEAPKTFQKGGVPTIRCPSVPVGGLRPICLLKDGKFGGNSGISDENSATTAD